LIVLPTEYIKWNVQIIKMILQYLQSTTCQIVDGRSEVAIEVHDNLFVELSEIVAFCPTKGGEKHLYKVLMHIWANQKTESCL